MDSTRIGVHPGASPWLCVLIPGPRLHRVGGRGGLGEGAMEAPPLVYSHSNPFMSLARSRFQTQDFSFAVVGGHQTFDMSLRYGVPKNVGVRLGSQGP